MDDFLEKNAEFYDVNQGICGKYVSKNISSLSRWETFDLNQQPLYQDNLYDKTDTNDDAK